MREDVLVWLLPDVREEERARVRRVVTGLRLLRDDARQRVARRVEPSWARAREELERLERAQRLRALESLLHAHLEACLACDTFLDLGVREPGYEAAWRTLLSGEAFEGFPPEPGDAPLAVVDNLLAAAAAGGAPRVWSELWGARRQHVAVGAARAEKHWDQLFRQARSRNRRPLIQARFLAGLVAARLDRFEPRRALELGAENQHLLELDFGLRRLLGWSALLCDEFSAARAWLSSPAPCAAADLPLGLVELARAWPDGRELLVGRARTGATAPELERRTSRRDLGAVLFAVFAPRADGTLETLALDAAPALRAGIERRLAERAGAWRRAGEPEQRLTAGSAVQRWHRSGGDACQPCAVLGTSRTKALVLVPVLDFANRTRGWLHLESEHHLLPSGPRLRSLARAWSPVLLTRETRSPTILTEVAPPRAPRLEWFAADDPRREFFECLVRILDKKSARRRVYWVEPQENELIVRAESGGALADWREQSGGAGDVQRSLHERTSVLCSTARSENSLHAAAASGLVVPLLAGMRGEVLGCLVIESLRRGDFDASDLSASGRFLEALAPLWWTTSFRAWHREEWGADLAWEGEGHFLASLEPALRAAADARSPLFLQGPIGAGRRTLSRWLHFRAERRASRWVEGPGEPGPGTRVFELETLGTGQQRELALALQAGGSGRAVFLVEEPPRILREGGRLLRDLERRVDPVPLLVPPLVERRDELPGLARVLVHNVARREALAAPTFRDEAMADLWRQDWRGNVPELASVVVQLVRRHPGAEIDGARVRAACLSRRLAFRERLPSLRPRSEDLLAALRATRHKSGSWNRARAARYLGWDADTLEVRMRERGLGELEAQKEGKDGAAPVASGLVVPTPRRPPRLDP